jgi:steroid 5-alpha reductase family enzyme
MIALMTILWVVHLVIHNAGIVDFGWALGLALLGSLYACLGTGYGPRRILIVSMALIWGLRLAAHILFDRVINHPEDARYQTLRQEWGGNLPLKFFFFFQAQAVLDVVLSIPFLLMSMNHTPRLFSVEWAGLFLWVLAIYGESAADADLKQFKANPANKGKTCRQGLWNYSRHPNYFFEWLIWVAFAIAALPSPQGPISILCPVLMFIFLFKVSGIPMTEAQALKSRGEDYRDYQRTTSVFVPWFKKQ